MRTSEPRMATRNADLGDGVPGHETRASNTLNKEAQQPEEGQTDEEQTNASDSVGETVELPEADGVPRVSLHKSAFN